MQRECKMGEYEVQIIKFLKSILKHFTSKISNTWILTEEYLQLDLHCSEVWQEFELAALKNICRKQTKEFENLLDWVDLDQDFLISAFPQNKLRIKWYKKDIN